MNEALQKTNDPYAIPLAEINVADPALFMHDQHWAFFDRLREEAPVHYCHDSVCGPFWSITRFNDIMEIEKNPVAFSSEGSITLMDRPQNFNTESFISMDPPKHDVQRMSVTGVVAPVNLAKLEPIIRERACNILDDLPIDEPFNWVDEVSIELTTQMLATLFDFPYEDRYRLTYWSDMATSSELQGGPTPESERQAALRECLEVFTELWNERVKRDPNDSFDLITMMAHNRDMQNMDPLEYLGNLILLIVGGNDTTRNSLTGGIYFMNQFPEQFEKLKANHKLIPKAVPEIIRYQTPLAYMRRTATKDVQFHDQQIREGDKVAMWYVSGNRDATVIENPYQFDIARDNPRHHLSFGFGIHRCMGNRLAEMQLRIVWEEILKRFHDIEVVGDPLRVQSFFVKGYEDLPVIIHAC